MKIPIACFILSLTTPSFGAPCAPEKLARIVVHNITPGVSRESAEGQPTLILRHGARYGRIEQKANLQTGAPATTIVNEPDVWAVNHETGQGIHMVDPGPTFEFHAPVLWSEGLPDWFRALEFGCEIDFMKKMGVVEPRTTEFRKRTVDVYDVARGEFRVMLLVFQDSQKPTAITLFKGGNVVAAIRYDSYDLSLEADLSLFQRPEDVTFTEQE